MSELSVPLGTLFKANGQHRNVFVIDSVENGRVNTTWEDVMMKGYYSVEEVNNFFANGSWIVYTDDDVFVTEDGAVLRVGDTMWIVQSASLCIHAEVVRYFDVNGAGKEDFPRLRFFSTEKLAKEYVEDAKRTRIPRRVVYFRRDPEKGHCC